MTAYKTHAEFERGRYKEPTSCAGWLEIEDESAVDWTLICSECVFSVCLHAKDRDPNTALRVQQKRAASWRETSGIPPELCGVMWHDVADTDPAVLAAAQRCAAEEMRCTPPTSSADPHQVTLHPRSAGPNSRPGLVLVGEVGVGKSMLAAATAWALLERRPVKWFLTANLMRLLGADFKSEQFAEADTVIRGTDALVLDDIHDAKPSENAALNLKTAIDNRITAGAPLIVTTNLGLDDIAARYPTHGNAIVSRLVGSCSILEVRGHDRRLRSVA